MRQIAYIVLLSLIIMPGKICAQKDTQKTTFRLPAVIEHGDTIPVYTLEDTKVDPVNYTDTTGWDRMSRNVRFLMPYAKECARKMHELDVKIVQMDRRRDKRKYLRQERSDLVKHFADTLKMFSNYQGEMLIKLINRETGRTTYDLIKEYESGFTAGMWQTVSRLDGMNLKDTYDPKKDVLLSIAIKMAGY